MAESEESQINRLVGAEVRRLRTALGLSQEDFAEKCGIHRTYVGAIERGECNITLATLENIALALGEHPADLLSRALGRRLHRCRRLCPRPAALVLKESADDALHNLGEI